MLGRTGSARLAAASSPTFSSPSSSSHPPPALAPTLSETERLLLVTQSKEYIALAQRVRELEYQLNSTSATGAGPSPAASGSSFGVPVSSLLDARGDEPVLTLLPAGSFSARESSLIYRVKLLPSGAVHLLNADSTRLFFRIMPMTEMTDYVKYTIYSDDDLPIVRAELSYQPKSAWTLTYLRSQTKPSLSVRLESSASKVSAEKFSFEWDQKPASTTGVDGFEWRVLLSDGQELARVSKSGALEYPLGFSIQVTSGFDPLVPLVLAVTNHRVHISTFALITVQANSS